jgi:ribosome-binding factor A
MAKYERREIAQRTKRKKDRKQQRHRDQAAGEGARTLRLQQLIREELNFLLRGEVRDPRLDSVEVTMVELSGDGSRARVWFTAEREDEALDALDGAAGFLRDDLAESLGLKRTPELRFRRDPATRLYGEPATKAPL